MFLEKTRETVLSDHLQIVMNTPSGLIQVITAPFTERATISVQRGMSKAFLKCKLQRYEENVCDTIR